MTTTSQRFSIALGLAGIALAWYWSQRNMAVLKGLTTRPQVPSPLSNYGGGGIGDQGPTRGGLVQPVPFIPDLGSAVDSSMLPGMTGVDPLTGDLIVPPLGDIYASDPWNEIGGDF